MPHVTPRSVGRIGCAYLHCFGFWSWRLMFAALAGVALGASPGQAKLILIAHRGASASAPENTLVSFNRASTVADYVELDVWPTKDGQLVVVHDGTLERTTNGKGRVSDLTLAQIRQLDAGSWFGPAFAGEQIPTADEAIAAIQKESAPFLERKEGSVEQFVALLQRQPLRPEGIVMSFDYAFVVDLKRAKPDVQVGWIGSTMLTDAQINQAVADGITHFVWSHGGVSPSVVKAIHRAGGLVLAWTINDPGTVAALDDMGIDGIITDRAEEFATLPAFGSALVSDEIRPPNQMLVRLGGSAVLAAAAQVRPGRRAEWRRADDPKIIRTGSRLRVRAENAQSFGRYRASWMKDRQKVEQDYWLSAGSADNRLVNISARMTVGSGEATGIVGFVVRSAHSPKFLVRAVGPSLTAFGITDPVRQPSLTLYRRNEVIDSDSMSSRIPANRLDYARNGAFPLTEGSNDVAIMRSLEGGAYTVHLSSKNGEFGVGLIEVYQDNSAANWALGAPVNLSLRGRAIPGSPLIGGFVVPDGDCQTLLVRGIGPSLATLGVDEPLRDPIIRIFDSKGSIVAENDDWWSEDDAAEIQDVAAQVGAFRIRTGRDAAVLATLPPGPYTVVLADASAARSGVAMLEIYAVGAP